MNFQNIETAFIRAREIRQKNVETQQARGERNVRLPEPVDEPVLEVPKQEIGNFKDIRTPNSVIELGKSIGESAQEVLAERTEDQRQIVSVENEEHRRETKKQEELNQNPLPEQTQIGRNIDRLV